MCENRHIRVWSFSGISSRIQHLAHMPCCSSWSFYPKTVEIIVLNEMHTNSYTGPRLTGKFRDYILQNEEIMDLNAQQCVTA